MTKVFEPTTTARAQELKKLFTKKLGHPISIRQWGGSMKGYYHLSGQTPFEKEFIMDILDNELHVGDTFTGDGFRPYIDFAFLTKEERADQDRKIREKQVHEKNR